VRYDGLGATWPSHGQISRVNLALRVIQPAITQMDSPCDFDFADQSGQGKMAVATFVHEISKDVEFQRIYKLE
jgi:hypothetical protein